MIINPSDVNEVQNLNKGEIAFPGIGYSDYPNLQLDNTTLLAAYTNITNDVGMVYFDGLQWNPSGNIQWQLGMLEHLSDSIVQMISVYLNNPNDALLRKIFVWIQLWGGNAGRGIFIRDEGFENNFNPHVYSNSIPLILNGDYQNALTLLNQTNWLGTAFSTKHIHFWSSGDAPIFDSIISKIVFGEKEPSHLRYTHYIDALDSLILELSNSGQPGITRRKIERNLFNWANTDDGARWIQIRTQE